MCIRTLIIIAFSALTFSCASSQKKAENASPVPATPAASATPAPVTTTSSDVGANKTTCSHGQDKRYMEIDKSQPAGCELKYSRFSEKDPVAWSFKGPTHCEKVRDQIKNTLEGAGFKCEPSADSPKVATQPAAK